MANTLANDVRTIYEKAFATISGILDVFPDEKFLSPHGDEYYIPSRIAYHLATFIDGSVAGGSKDPDFREKVPFGSWRDGTAETLPDKKALISYYNAVVDRARNVLAAVDDAFVTAPIEPEKARMGASQIAAYLYSIREIAAHTGELNKMLIENGLDDVWR